MLRDGALENPRPSAIFAVHTSPFPVGLIGFPRGLALPGLDTAVITLNGNDAESVAGKLREKISALSTVPPETLRGDPSKAVLTNFVYPSVWVETRGDEKVVQVHLRASSEENYSATKMRILALAKEAAAGGVKARTEYVDRQLPDTINDQRLVEGAMKALTKLAGEQSVIPVDGASPFFGEDFSHFQKMIPGAIFWLGVSNPEKGILGVPHSPGYQADDAAIEFGARAMAAVLWDYLSSDPKR